jgi:hypothetical protein
MNDWTQPIYPEELLLDSETNPRDAHRILEKARQIDMQREAKALMDRMSKADA